MARAKSACFASLVNSTQDWWWTKFVSSHSARQVNCWAACPAVGAQTNKNYGKHVPISHLGCHRYSTFPWAAKIRPRAVHRGSSRRPWNLLWGLVASKEQWKSFMACWSKTLADHQFSKDEDLQRIECCWTQSWGRNQAKAANRAAKWLLEPLPCHDV